MHLPQYGFCFLFPDQTYTLQPPVVPPVRNNPILKPPCPAQIHACVFFVKAT